MPPSPQPAAPPESVRHEHRTFDWRIVPAGLLLAIAAVFTRQTIDGLSARRQVRTELAEISHARYGLLNMNVWVEDLIPILDARIDALDLKTASRSLRPTIQSALYRLLDQVKESMTAKKPASTGGASPGGFLSAGNPLVVNMIVGALKPHVPEYTNVVMAELGTQQTQTALKKYIKSVLAEGARDTFAKVDTTRYSSILKEHGCADAASCQTKLADQVRELDGQIRYRYLAVLISSAIAFILLMFGRPVLGRPAIVVLLLFCAVLLVGGVLTPMIEVEAKITRLSFTFLGEPIEFGEQVLYFQSKSVLEVFHTLITYGRPDMWVVGVLVLMFSVVFPCIKILTSVSCLFKPSLLRNRIARFFALESSKWSMADVMALAIFMSYVAFNGLISSTMNGIKETGVELAIPTDSSKILPGCYLFIGFCIASLFFSKKLEHGIRTSAGSTEPN